MFILLKLIIIKTKRTRDIFLYIIIRITLNYTNYMQINAFFLYIYIYASRCVNWSQHAHASYNIIHFIVIRYYKNILSAHMSMDFSYIERDRSVYCI